MNLSPTGPARTQIGLMLRELERAFERSLEKESVEFGVTPSQVDILTVLSMNRWLGMTAIARELDIDRSTAAKAVRALVAKGWVVQRAHPVDLRYQRFELTDDGFVATQVLLARADAAQQKVMSPLMGRDQHAFMNMLSEMVDTASNEGR